MTVSISRGLGRRVSVDHENVRHDPFRNSPPTHQVGTVAGARPSCIEIRQPQIDHELAAVFKPCRLKGVPASVPLLVDGFPSRRAL